MLGKLFVGAGAIGTVAMGGTAGAMYSGATDGNTATGATVGAIAGAGTVALGANAGNIAKWAGSSALESGKRFVDFAKNPVTHAKAAKIGSGIAGAGAKLGGLATNLSATAGTVGAGVAIKAGAKYGNIATSMFKINPNLGQPGNTGGMLKMTSGGKFMLAGGTAIGMGVSAFKTFNDARAGVSDGQVMTATPDMARSSNMRNAGATGDLAFAMRAQRHG